MMSRGLRICRRLGSVPRLRHRPGMMSRLICRRLGSIPRLPAFALERFFAKYEFSAKYLLCSSDTESVTLREALDEYADDECRFLFENLSLGYTESKGYPPLLEELKGLYDGFAQEVVPQEGILLSMMALVEPGDKVVATFPAYQSLYDVAASCGADVRYWMPTDNERFDVDKLRDLMPAKLVVVNFPHNPTGYVPSHDDWKDIVSLCEQHGAWLFADEMYRFLGPETLSAGADYERGVSLGGLSKSLGMPGVRIGWLACRDAAFIDKVASLRDWTTICSSAPSQVLGLVAVRARERLVARANAFITAGKASVVAAVQKRPHLLHWNSQHSAGPVGFVRLVRGSAFAYCETLAEHSGILLLPSTVYGAGDSHFRIGFGRRNTPDVVSRWEATLDDPNHPATRLLLDAP